MARTYSTKPAAVKARAQRAAKAAGKATEAVQAVEAPAQAVEAVEVAAATPHEPMNSVSRDALALRVLDLTLAGVEKQLVENPAGLNASALGAISRILGFYQKARADLDDGSAERAEHERTLAQLGDLPAFADDDKDDPMLQGNRRVEDHPAAVVSAEDISALSDFEAWDK